MSQLRNQGDERIEPLNYGYLCHAKKIAQTGPASTDNILTVFVGHNTQKHFVIKETSGNALAIEAWGDMDPTRTKADVENHDADLMTQFTLSASSVNSSTVLLSTTDTYSWITFRASGASATYSIWYNGL